MANQVTNVMAVLKAAKPIELVELDFVKDKFIALHNSFTGSDRGEQEYHVQVFNYKKMLSESSTLKDCSPLSLYGAFLDVNVNRLSLEQGPKPDCYITSKNFNVAPKGQPAVWEKRAQLAISPYGELKMRLRAGQIKYADNPVIVYEGDHFKVRTDAHGKSVEHEAVIPRKSKNIIASFIRLVRADGSVDFSVMTLEDIERLKGYSNRQNKGDAANDKANALYSSNGGQIDTGFLSAKTIKHAFSTYPKVNVGQFSAVESDEVHIPETVDYGIDPDLHSATGNTHDIEHEIVDDEFTNELNAQAQEEPEKTLVIAGDDDDEPEF